MEGFLGEGEVSGTELGLPFPLKPLLPRDYPSCAGERLLNCLRLKVSPPSGWYYVTTMLCPPHHVQEGMKPEGWPLLPPANKDEVQAQLA